MKNVITPPSPSSKVESVRLVLISFRNIAKNFEHFRHVIAINASSPFHLLRFFFQLLQNLHRENFCKFLNSKNFR